jgi:DNA-binding PadR family transcriptional regulator
MPFVCSLDPAPIALPEYDSPVRTSPTQTKALTATESAVLGLLAKGGERSGYELNKLAQAGVGYVWAPAKSQIYAVLPRLVGAGLARGRTVAQSDRPDKRLYQATELGRQALQEWLEQPSWRSLDELLLKLFFGDLLPRDRVVALLERYREHEEEKLAEYEAIERRIAGARSDYFGHVTLRLGLARARSAIGWANEVLAELTDRDGEEGAA